MVFGRVIALTASTENSYFCSTSMSFHCVMQFSVVRAKHTVDNLCSHDIFDAVKTHREGMVSRL